jgi:CheY-like chemotaxis protein
MDAADLSPRKARLMSASARPVEILLVEDDPGDVLITREAIEGSKFANNLNVVSNGELALAYLRREAPYEDAVRPGLILLDLNLPRLDGREVLAQVKQDPNLRRIPVVVLTTSSADQDIVRSYDLHANAYVTKPVDFDQFMSVVRQVDEFFISIVSLPPA